MAQWEEGSEEAEALSSESEEESQELVVRALRSYCSELDDSEVASTNLLQVTNYINTSCLICLSGIKRIQAVWNCKFCYTCFHLALFPGILSKWTCPKCRAEYDQADTPSVYQCFCGKEVDPPSDPWLLAHSCGEVCGCDLKSKCGHKCLSLCHPGPCPPCPKTILLSCYCERTPARSQRCGFPGWSCGGICKRTLACGFHTCEQQCHKGVCPPCCEEVIQPCVCGKKVEHRPCNQPQWSCEQTCDRLLPCLQHLCQKVCHSDSCGDCPRNGARFCPCGKKSFFLECTLEVACCGDTCSKVLTCGRHTCVRMCHFGDCGPCLQMTVKFCRCGLKEKSVLCHQEFLCDSRCQNMRRCGRHQCRRKCCDGNCAPCDRTCGRPLLCKTHKCSAPCHSGRCYPCVLSVSVACACSKTAVDVPCGRERTTRPPRCSQLCKLHPPCRHPSSAPHRCHFGECPPCTQTCHLPLPCSHLCAAPCHSRPVHQRRAKPAVPWNKMEPSFIIRPCPPCKQLVPMACYGRHEVLKLVCSEATGYSCARMCGRVLKCGNHSCKRSCHVVINAPDSNSAGEDCFACEEMCQKPRHKVCVHSCPLPCHSGECSPCEAVVKFPCHCSSVHIYVKCSEWYAADNNTRDQKKSCTGLCSKKLDCGHRCPQVCHPGPCVSKVQCRKKITIRCPCRRLKKEWQCNEQQEVNCNEECMEKQNEVADKSAAEAIALKEKEEKEAATLLERQLRPRKRKRKVIQVENPPQAVPFYTSVAFQLIIALLLCILMLVIVYKTMQYNGLYY